MSNYNFFFIHNYKVLGTTIYSQLPHSYNKLLYGLRTPNDVIDKNPGIQLNKLPYIDLDKKMSIDHIHIDTIIALGLIKIPLKEIKFMMIMRDPIERLVSICNFKGVAMEKMIANLKNNIGDNFYQHKFVKNKNNINVELFKMEDKIGIINFFNQFGINMNLDIKKNVSIKKYNICDISHEDIMFLKKFYKEDYDLYNSI
jgi:hypothetical protein